MASQAGFRRFKRRAIDTAISNTFSRHTGKDRLLEVFDELLFVSRQRSTLLRASVGNDGAGAVAALANLASYGDDFIRSPSTWGGMKGAARRQIASLAQHLFSEFELPRFIGSVWFEPGVQVL